MADIKVGDVVKLAPKTGDDEANPRHLKVIDVSRDGGKPFASVTKEPDDGAGCVGSFFLADLVFVQKAEPENKDK